MSVEHLRELDGLPAFTFPHAGEESGRPLPDAGSVAWRVAIHSWESEETWAEAFDRFLKSVDTSRVRALIVGCWGESYDTSSAVPVERLAAAKDLLPALRAVFVGDMESEESEISWIQQSDVTPVLDAYPELRVLGVRGGSGLAFPAVRHERLRKLYVESGGLPAGVVRGIGASELAALEHLELWLGVPEYGGDAEAADLAPLLSGTRFPALRHLGLCNAEIQDEIAAAVASSPLVARLESLDLSMGVLTDEGAAALLDGQPLTHLSSLDLHHNYLSDPMVRRITDALAPSGVEVDLSSSGYEDEDELDGEVFRYTAVAE
ncbi:STM4015 family protein [Streptomyces sp. GC420]|uniref:STM4015 family protein n=1 Tax=Streptomyces sp. GC420 TaxID=2697568 RepID=UPI001414D10E|nr:STM4015 family protein [Streptomyces sp. GC420]NBM16906.1 leucine-rich repeat domain-containing protein [Streptomyces sp. GC420]